MRVGAMVVGGACMVAGYFTAEVVFARLLGIAPTPAAAIGLAASEIPFNLVQVIAGIVIGGPVASRLQAMIRGGTMPRV